MLGLSQSAVSRQISALEQDLNVPLFHRHARGLILTEQGELLYRTAHDVYSKLSVAKTLLTDSKERPTGELRVTTTVGLGSAWLTPRIREFLEIYPEISLRLILADEPPDLTMREADVGIWLSEPEQGEVIRRKLFTVHLHIYASPDYLRHHGTPQQADDLDNHRIVIFGDTAPAYLSEINLLATIGRPEGDPRQPVARINNVYGLKRAVESGIGIAALPDYMIPENSGLVQILRDVAMPQFDTYFVYPEELRNSKRMSVFRDFLLTKARAWSF